LNKDRQDLKKCISSAAKKKVGSALKGGLHKVPHRQERRQTTKKGEEEKKEGECTGRRNRCAGKKGSEKNKALFQEVLHQEGKGDGPVRLKGRHSVNPGGRKSTDARMDRKGSHQRHCRPVCNLNGKHQLNAVIRGFEWGGGTRGKRGGGRNEQGLTPGKTQFPRRGLRISGDQDLRPKSLQKGLRSKNGRGAPHPKTQGKSRGNG